MSAGSEEIKAAIITLTQERGQEKTVCPSEVARNLAGKDEKQWRLLMKPIRSAAVQLAKQGKITIRRKGNVVDPDNFKGVYRLAIAED